MNAIHRAQHEHLLYINFLSVFFYFTGESFFRSFFPLESSPFFFLFARSWESRGSTGMWGPLVGLRGLMVPGRRGRTIGDGARTGVVSLLTASVVSVVACEEKWWGGMEVWGSILQMNQLFHTETLSLSLCVSSAKRCLKKHFICFKFDQIPWATQRMKISSLSSLFQKNNFVF